MAGLAGNTRGLNPLLKLRDFSHLYTLCTGFVTALSHDYSSKPEGTDSYGFMREGAVTGPMLSLQSCPALCLRGRNTLLTRG
jgi:hypothetical protein